MSLQKLKEIIKEKDVVYGSERTIKNLKLGKQKSFFWLLIALTMCEKQ